LLKNEEYDVKKTINSIVDMANQARRDGLLSLEGAIQNLEEPFLKKD
jgi:chemotaxis protein MotA